MPVTKEAVEREIRLLEAGASDCHVRTETVELLRALSARVEELEEENSKQSERLLCLGIPKFGPASGPSILHDEDFSVAGSDAAIRHFKSLYVRRRLQGLDEAICAGNEVYKDLYAEIDHAGPVGQRSVQSAIGATAVLRAIEALKGSSND